MTATIGTWAGAFGAGAILGAAYLVLLWLSVRTLSRPSRSASFQVGAFLLQLLVRFGLVLGVLMAAIELDATLAEIAWAVVGFVVARVTITAFVRRQDREAR